MPTLDRDGHEGLGWPIAGAEEAWCGDGPVLLELAAFRAAVGRNAVVGVVLDVDTPHEVLDEVTPSAAAVAIRFRLFRDGRGMTLEAISNRLSNAPIALAG